MSSLVVSRSNRAAVVIKLREARKIALDLETTGLHPHHGDKLFSMALATEDTEYYFNFQNYEGLPEGFLLPALVMLELGEIFEDESKTWFIHNAKFDLSFLKAEGISLSGNVHCTYVGARLEDNNHESLSLAECAARLGGAKDDGAHNWIKANSAYKKVLINERIVTKPDYTAVPFQIISSYAMQDARQCFQLGIHQLTRFAIWAAQAPSLPTVLDVLKNENELTKTLLNMELLGVKIDVLYCKKAAEFCTQQMELAVTSFEKITGQSFKMSPKLFADVFIDDKPHWQYTEKHNPSFVSDVIKEFSNEAAAEVIRYREAKTKSDFFNGFLEARDSNDCIHTSFNPGRAKTGRFSSSNPNLQNLKRQDERGEFEVRDAIIPRPGFFFAMFDFQQIEYRMMLDMAGSNRLINEVLGGLDVHEATAKLARVSRREAKTVNFLTLYGGGVKRLSEALDKTESEARSIQQAIFAASPEIKQFIRTVISKAETRGWIFNWFGRRYYYPDKTKCYRAPNALIQGGAADVLKIVMNQVARFLEDKKSRMVLTIHDELVFEIAEDEVHILDIIKTIMESVYPYKKLPLTVSVDHSLKSLGSKIAGTDVDLSGGAEKSRN